MPINAFKKMLKTLRPGNRKIVIDAPKGNPTRIAAPTAMKLTCSERPTIFHQTRVERHDHGESGLQG
jgi:hypothetical protein